ncbi:hypothetical protein ASPFODRAFT_645792 [Aspergillus luchuensis CBS 106.47]|uniref:Uncharacterized protein n=1 Tax=Aspergillus luchuensis (strain CBS 106.47) TaxID=1137211 RepID=A0A1M3TDR4_ASPLC|nr:hypothetical protein ASPFODRAFT_645792 [Aspergillus luchuensis CBS 106.47]
MNIIVEATGPVCVDRNGVKCSRRIGKIETRRSIATNRGSGCAAPPNWRRINQRLTSVSQPRFSLQQTNRSSYASHSSFSPPAVLLFCTFSSPCFLLRSNYIPSPHTLAASDLDQYRSGTFRSHGPVDRTPFLHSSIRCQSDLVEKQSNPIIQQSIYFAPAAPQPFIHGCLAPGPD